MAPPVGRGRFASGDWIFLFVNWILRSYCCFCVCEVSSVDREVHATAGQEAGAT
jgi:hypothetical protein